MIHQGQGPILFHEEVHGVLGTERTDEIRQTWHSPYILSLRRSLCNEGLWKSLSNVAGGVPCVNTIGHILTIDE
jgi:hypothetical protein